MAVPQPTASMANAVLMRSCNRRVLSQLPGCLVLLVVLFFMYSQKYNGRTVIIASTDQHPRVPYEDREIVTTSPDPLASVGCPGKEHIRASLDYDGSIFRQGNTDETLMANLNKTKYCQKAKVLILVTSHASHADRRIAIRQTWGGMWSDREWKTVFVLARLQYDDAKKNAAAQKAVDSEIALFNDVIQGDFTEDFYNMSLKVRLAFEWASLYSNFDFVLKADDDVYVNMPAVLEFVNNEDIPSDGLYTGHVQFIAEVKRKGKYAVSKEEYKHTIYPRYCSGGGFIMSQDVVHAVAKAMIKIPKALKIDDVYIGEAALKAGVNAYPSKNFDMEVKGCSFKETRIIHHPADVECLMKLHTNALHIALTT